MHTTVTRLLRAVVVPSVVALLVGTAGPAVAGRPKPPAPVTPEPTGFVLGVAAPGAPWDLTEVDRLSADLGRPVDAVVSYAAWASESTFPADAARQVAARGAVPEITWEPWDHSAGAHQPAYSLRSIAAGQHDGYVRSWARQVKGYGGPVVLRFAHEMNGSWYPWSEQTSGDGPGDYVRAWRHVWNVFRKVGVPNVRWRWSPNVSYPGSTPLAGLYPGDAYVDEVAVDGYNWAGSLPGTSWTSFADLFGPTLAEIAAITTTRPVFIGEVGCPETGGDKAAWIRDMGAYLQQHPEVRGVTWFNFDKEMDWRIQSSPESLAAFREVLAGLQSPS